MSFQLPDQSQMKLVLFLCGCAVVAVAPFALMRLVDGEWLMATLDTAIVAGMMAIAVSAWYSGQARIASLLLAVLYTGGVVGLTYLRGEAVIYWLYPCVLANFFILPVWRALSINVVALIALLPNVDVFNTPLELPGVIVTLALVNLFAYVFSRRAAEQQERLRNLASRDPLTGVGNRRSLEEAMVRSIGLRERIGNAHSLIMFDLDHFKKINDLCGHDGGDRVLIDLVGLIARRIRRADRLFRYGGEEFVLLLPETRLADAKELAEDLRGLLARELVGADGTVTASFGCAELAWEEDWEKWLARADRALYSAKGRGRNCVETSRPEPGARVTSIHRSRT